MNSEGQWLTEQNTPTQAHTLSPYCVSGTIQALETQKVQSHLWRVQTLADEWSGEGNYHWELATWNKSPLYHNRSCGNCFFTCWGRERGGGSAMSITILRAQPAISHPSRYWKTGIQDTRARHSLVGDAGPATPTMTTEDKGGAGPGWGGQEALEKSLSEVHGQIQKGLQQDIHFF